MDRAGSYACTCIRYGASDLYWGHRPTTLASLTLRVGEYHCIFAVLIIAFLVLLPPSGIAGLSIVYYSIVVLNKGSDSLRKRVIL